MTLSVEDKMAILELVARYNHAVDYGDSDAYVKTFTPDGIFTMGDWTMRGTEELRAFVEKKAQQGDLNTRHWTSSHVVEGDGDTATHSSYIMIIEMGEIPTISATGIYHDKLKNVNGEWKFSRRQVIKECPSDA